MQSRSAAAPADAFLAFDGGGASFRAGARFTRPLLTVLHPFTLRSHTCRVIALGDLARDVSVDFFLNKTRSAVPKIVWLGKVGIATDATPERGAIERFTTAEPSAQLRDIERAQLCSLKIRHSEPRVATRGIQSQLPAN
jgi:hypothetical protein